MARLTSKMKSYVAGTEYIQLERNATNLETKKGTFASMLRLYFEVLDFEGIICTFREDSNSSVLCSKLAIGMLICTTTTVHFSPLLFAHINFVNDCRFIKMHACILE